MEKFEADEIRMSKSTTIEDINIGVIDDDDGVCDMVAQQIRINLQEPHGELIGKIVSTLGVKKALYFYQKTRMIEENGGLLVQDGSRKRTPGGVFFHLITNEKTIPKTMIKEIFYDSSQETKKKKNEEIRERRRKSNSKLKELLIKEGLLSTLPK